MINIEAKDGSPKKNETLTKLLWKLVYLYTPKFNKLTILSIFDISLNIIRAKYINKFKTQIKIIALIYNLSECCIFSTFKNFKM